MTGVWYEWDYVKLGWNNEPKFSWCDARNGVCAKGKDDGMCAEGVHVRKDG